MMEANETAKKVMRLFKIVTTIQARPGVKASDLATQFGVTVRTVYRDLQVLQDAGVPWYFDRATNGYRLAEGYVLRPLTFTFEEALSVLLSMSTMAAQKGTPFARNIGSARDKILAVMSSSHKEFTDLIGTRIDFSLPSSIDYSKVSDIFEELDGCILKGYQIKMKYVSRKTSDTVDRVVDPYALMFRANAWYMVAFCHLRGETRTFRIDRIKELKKTGANFEVPSDFSLEKYMAGSWQVERGEEQTVRIRFAPETAAWVREVQFHPSQQVEDLPDGGIVFTARVAVTDELKRWVLGFGAEAEVLEPEGLRGEVKWNLFTAGKLYP